VNEEFKNLSNHEMIALIKRAEDELDRRKSSGKKELKNEIESKLKAAGLELADIFPDAGIKRSRSTAPKESSDTKPVPVKYKDPVSGGAWSGRGARPPHWVKLIMSQRRWTLDEFKKSGEYDV